METEKKSGNKIWLNLIFVVVILLLGITVVGSLQDINKVIEEIKKLDIIFFIMAFVAGLIGLLLMSLSSQIVFRAINKKLDYKTGFLIQTVEPFFNGITPFSSGAQPFQIYFYKSHNVAASESTSVLLVNFILFQISSVALSTFGLIIYWDLISQSLGNNMFFMLIGYGINTLVLVGLFLIAYVRRFKYFIMMIMDLLAKIKFLTNKMNKSKEKAENFVMHFQSGVKFLFTKKRVFILGLLTKITSIVFTYGTTLLIVKALGLNYNFSDNAYMVFAGLLAATSMFFVPLPGGSGGTELVFSLLFSIISPDATIAVTIMLLWRFITYYFAMFYGFVGYLLLKRQKVKNI